MTDNSQFAADVKKWIDSVDIKATELLRAIALEVLSRVVLRSPVGNPDLWKANAEVVANRKAIQIARRVSKRRLQREAPLKSGRGYVGGRFRGNWVVSIGSPSNATTEAVDPQGQRVLAEGGAVISNAKWGAVIYVMNNLPYAVPLEYGHSQQAPAGMVRVTAAEFSAIVADVSRQA